MNLSEEFKLYENMWDITESKTDTQNLVDFAGADLADRFLNIKSRLAAPENDLYYWIKHKTPEELEQTVAALENSKSIARSKKDIADAGAKLVAETPDWKVYLITTFEAAQKYGRDTKWCITGVDGQGDKYWKEYADQNITFYFFITKHKYNSRGASSKFALALYPADEDGYIPYEAFDQQDTQVLLDDIYNIKNITLPGIKNMKLLYAQGLDRCCMCDDPVSEENAFYDADDNCYCEFCYNETFG